jgi:hypothetical protein
MMFILDICILISYIVIVFGTWVIFGLWDLNRSFNYHHVQIMNRFELGLNSICVILEVVCVGYALAIDYESILHNFTIPSLFLTAVFVICLAQQSVMGRTTGARYTAMFFSVLCFAKNVSAFWNLSRGDEESSILCVIIIFTTCIEMITIIIADHTSFEDSIRSHAPKMENIDEE